MDDPGTLDPSAYELEVAATRAGEHDLNCREYGIALRRGFVHGLDAGAAFCAVDPTDAGAASGMGFDLKLARPEGRGWRPALFARLDASVPDLGTPSLQWDGIACGAAWTPAGNELYVELGGFAPEGDRGATSEVSLGLALAREVRPDWTVFAEWGHLPFDGAGRDAHALLGVARQWAGLGAVSVGYAMAQDTHGHWTPSHWTFGLTRELSPGF